MQAIGRRTGVLSSSNPRQRNPHVISALLPAHLLSLGLAGKPRAVRNPTFRLHLGLEVRKLAVFRLLHHAAVARASWQARHCIPARRSTTLHSLGHRSYRHAAGRWIILFDREGPGSPCTCCPRRLTSTYLDHRARRVHASAAKAMRPDIGKARYI